MALFPFLPPLEMVKKTEVKIAAEMTPLNLPLAW
tara:strand:+ start:212 stop:313 length:102 start_codon:yes stop_codon:yes gene_type:complete